MQRPAITLLAVLNSKKSEGEELYGSEIRIGKRVSTKPRHDVSKKQCRRWRKGQNRQRVFSLWTHRPRWSRLQIPKPTLMEDLRQPHPRAAVLAIVMKKRKKSREMCREASLIWGFLRCCQTTVTPRKTMWLLTNLEVNPQTPCHRCHRFLRFKETRTSRRAKSALRAMSETSQQQRSP